MKKPRIVSAIPESTSVALDPINFKHDCYTLGVVFILILNPSGQLKLWLLRILLSDDRADI